MTTCSSSAAAGGGCGAHGGEAGTCRHPSSRPLHDRAPSGLSRRAVLTAAGAVGAAGLLAACGGGSDTPIAAATGSPDDEVIVDLETLRTEGAVVFRTGDGEALAVDVDGEVVAYSRRCTHEGCAVNWDADRQLISCPCHGSRFDPVDDGAVVAGPARSPLPRIDVVVDEDAGVLLRA